MNQVALKEVPSTRGNFSQLNFHKGEALCRVAAEYPTILDVILEQVQNAIDANASSITVVLNSKTRHIAIRDNGNGVSQDSFEEALQNVCQSQKKAGKLGRFGIGLVSPLGKCDYFTFTSCPVGIDFGFKEWKFTTSDIRRESEVVAVPLRSREDILFVSSQNRQAPKGLTSVMWRTEVNIFNFSRDKMISRIESIEALRDAILERFSFAMRRNKVSLNLRFTKANGAKEALDDIKPQPFTGRPLQQFVHNDADAGLVTFRLFLATKTTKGHKGKVLVGETDNDFRFGFDLFARSSERLLPEEVVSALSSGVFEGEITAERVKLHSTRRSFEKDDAMVGFCAAIDFWFQKHGAKHVEEVNEARREQRYQDLGQESLKEIEAMLQDPAFADIRSALDSFKLGSVDPSCTINTRTLSGQQDENAVLTDYEPGPQQNTGSTETASSVAGKSPSSREANPEPYTVAGPKGHKRALVKRGNLGLQFSYIAMDGSDRLWELDIRQGILHFNVNHPIWVACDVSDRKVRQLQETVAIQSLMTEILPDQYKDDMREVFDMALRPLIHVYHESPAFTIGRKKIKL